MYSDNKYVYSGLTSGTQWDMMMKYLQEKGDKVNVTSSNWGNYDNVSLENLRGYYTNVTTNGVTDGFKEVGSLKTNAGTSSYVLLTTGSTEQVMKNNLYDVAGNLWEWTTTTQHTTHTLFVVVLSAMTTRPSQHGTVLTVVRRMPTLTTASAPHFI